MISQIFHIFCYLLNRRISINDILYPLKKRNYFKIIMQLHVKFHELHKVVAEIL